jgi:hypothetical protein
MGSPPQIDMQPDANNEPSDAEPQTIVRPSPTDPPPTGPSLGRGGARSRQSRLSHGCKRLTQLGWPRDFPIVQFPNAPLAVALLTGITAARVHGSAHAYLAAVSILALGIWAYEELVHGVNWFRRLLGLGFAISIVVHLAHALQR